MQQKEAVIIQAFIDAGEAFVSGEGLADRLGISRVALRPHLDRLRQQGFAIEAVRSKGYRLTSPPARLHAGLVQAYLPRGARDLSVKLYEQLGSTNSEAERLLASDEPTPFLVIARRQTSGRGRLGRQWHSQDEGNLYASFAFRPKVSPARLSNLTLWMGVNLCECLNSFCQTRTLVKWPNDLQIDGRKVAGMLTEARIDSDQTRDLVLGLGLNINGSSCDLPAEVRQQATSLLESTGKRVEANRLVAALAGRVLLAYDAFVSGDYLADFAARWDALDGLKGKTVSLWQGGTRISGVAEGLGSQGALVVKKSDGSRFLARAGDVTLGK